MASIKISDLYYTEYEDNLKTEELRIVKGGLLPLVAVLTVVWFNREAIDDISQGFFDALYGNPSK